MNCTVILSWCKLLVINLKNELYESELYRIACLAVLLLTACDESKYELENLVPEEYHKVLYINKSGTQELTLYNTGELNTYAFSVYKGGSDPSLTASGEIAVHSQEEVDVLLWRGLSDNPFRFLFDGHRSIGFCVGGT